MTNKLVYPTNCENLVEIKAQFKIISMREAFDKETIILLGASSYIGSHFLRAEEVTSRFNIKAISRYGIKDKKTQATYQNIEFITADLNDYQSIQKVLIPKSIVINLAFSWRGGGQSNLRMIENVIEAAKIAKIKRLIHCSTVAVVGRVSDDLVTEVTPCCPIMPYGVTKLKIEETISEKGTNNFDVAILRPTSVFGPKGGPLKKLVGDMMGRSRARNYLKSCLFGARRMNLVSIANVVSAILFLAMHKDDLNGQKFIVSDDDSPANNFADVERVLMKKLNIKKYSIPKIPLPLGLLGLLLHTLGRNNTNPRCNYSAEKLKKLGFVPQVPFEAALDEYAEWYLTSLV